MNATAWLHRAFDAESKAYGAKTAAKRRRYAREAFDALLVAASLGNGDASFKVGLYYQHGSLGIVPARLDLAEHWLRLAAVSDAESMMALGTLLMQTDRKEEGRKWLRAALAHGEGGAACHLGRDFEDKSPSRALRMYLKGVALGEPFAAYCAAEVLETRKSRRALLQAEALYKEAAQKLDFVDDNLERVRHKLSLLASARRRPARKRRR